MCWERWLCESSKIFIINELDDSKASRAWELRSRQKSTRGGWSETEENEFMVRPQGLAFESRVVTMATPVANRPQAQRNDSAVRASGELSMGFELDKGLTLILS